MGGWCHIDSSKVTVPFPGLSGIKGKLTAGLSSCLSVPWPPMSPCLCRLTPSLLVVPSRVLVAECRGHCLHPGGPRALHRGRRHRLLHYHKALLVVPLHGQRESEASQSAPAARVVGVGVRGRLTLPTLVGEQLLSPCHALLSAHSKPVSLPASQQRPQTLIIRAGSTCFNLSGSQWRVGLAAPALALHVLLSLLTFPFTCSHRANPFLSLP